MMVRWAAMTCVLACLAGVTASASAAVKPEVTNKRRFLIPFRFDAAALQRMNARELQLLMSSNRGTSWELAQTIKPQSGKFEFQAPADGEYWFSVRMIDGFGAAHPPGPQPKTGLIVIVDTIAPTLAVNLEQVAPGRIQLTWSASDANLDPTTLRLEYLQPGTTGWQAVGVVPTQRGMTTWNIPTGGQVAIRGSISDLAGNVGETRSDVEVASPRRTPDPAKPDLRQPIASEPGADQFSESTPTDTPVPQMTIQPRTAAAGVPGLAAPLVSSSQDSRPSVVQDRWSTPEAAPQESFRPSSRQRIVNTRRFQLGYKVDDVGPSGVGAVELFITTDQGRQWYRYGEDSDRRSPFDVEVPRDGDYGFEIRVRSGAGLSLDPPLPGEKPSILVTVDQTPPRIELLPIQQGSGADLNKVEIHWRVSELHPAEKSVSLYYATSLQGPWELISDWRPDTGSYTWVVGPGNPSQFYVRAMVRDAAGNVGQIDTVQPVLVDLTRPSARIVDVEIQSGPTR